MDTLAFIPPEGTTPAQREILQRMLQAMVPFLVELESASGSLAATT